MKLILLLSIAFLGCNGQITMQLSDVYVLRGKDADIPCSFKTSLSGEPTIKWYVIEDGQNELLYQVKVGNPSDTIDNSRKYDRPTYISPDGTLTLTTTTLNDNEIFKTLECEVAIGKNTNNSRLELTVIALPSGDPVFTPSSYSFSPGSEITVGSCKSGGGGEPVPVIAFYKNDEEIQTTKSEQDDFYADLESAAITWDAEDGTTGIKDTLVTSLTKSDNEATYYCIVESGIKGTGIYQRQNLTIPKFHVNYDTDEVNFVDPPSPVFAGTELELTCSANGYPEPTVRINGQSGSKFSVDVNKAADGMVYTCEASNDKAMEPDSIVSTTYTMNVLYADELSIEGRTNVTYDQSISLACVSNSKPESTGVHWERNGKSVSDNAELTVSKAMFSDAGTYECIAPNQHEQLVRKKEVQVTVSGLVVATKEYKVSSDESSNVVLTCEATAYPVPVFSWTRKADGEGSKEEAVIGAEMKSLGSNMYQSVLSLGPVTADLSKMTYTCRVTSGNNPAKMTVFTLPESADKDGDSEAMAQASSAGIIIGILVAIIVIAVVLAVLYNKGIICAKKDDGEEDAKDIAVKMSKDEEAPENNGDNHQSNYKQQDQIGEETELMNGEQNS